MVENINELKDVKNLYRILIFSIIFQILPFYGLQVFGFILFTVVLVWAYLLKAKYFDNPYGKSHAVHVIKTIWNFSSFLVIGMCIGGFWLYTTADQSALTSYTDEIMNTGAVSEEGMKSAYKQALKDNLGLVIKVGLITIGPPVIYLLGRIWIGSSNASIERRM